MVSEVANIFTDIHSVLHFMSYALSIYLITIWIPPIARSLLKALNDFPLLFKFLKITFIIH